MYKKKTVQIVLIIMPHLILSSKCCCLGNGTFYSSPSVKHGPVYKSIATVVKLGIYFTLIFLELIEYSDHYRY